MVAEQGIEKLPVPFVVLYERMGLEKRPVRPDVSSYEPAGFFRIAEMTLWIFDPP